MQPKTFGPPKGATRRAPIMIEKDVRTHGEAAVTRTGIKAEIKTRGVAPAAERRKRKRFCAIESGHGRLAVSPSKPTAAQNPRPDITMH